MKEDTINTVNRLFAGPKEGSGRAGVYAKASMSASENRGSNGTIERTSLMKKMELIKATL